MAYWYMSSPYREHPPGRAAAFRLACREASRLVGAGIPIYSPVAHAHAVGADWETDPAKQLIWLSLDGPLMDAAYGMILLMADGWEKSAKIGSERIVFERIGKPIVLMVPGSIPDELKPQT